MALLAQRYRELQKKFHPDRFASQSSVSQKRAVQYTALLNQAYTTLRAPVDRAQYLLAQRGVNGGDANSTIDDPEFLMTQLALRETLSEIDNIAALENFSVEVDLEYRRLQEHFDSQYTAGNLEEAVTTVAKMQFYRKLKDQIGQLEEELE